MSPSFDQFISDATELKPMYPSPEPMDAGTLPAEQSPQQLATKYSTMPVDQMVNDEICGMVKSRKEASRQWREEKRSIWDKCWEHYKQVYDSTGKEAWQSKTFQPDTAKVVETIASNLHSALLSPDMPAEWQCKVKQFEEQVRAINDIVGNDANKSRVKVHFTDLLRSLCITGIAIGKIGYDFEKEVTMVKERGKASLVDRMLAMALRRPEPVPQDTYSPQEMVVKDWANCEYRDPYKIYPEPYTTDISRKHWIIEEARITNRELVDLANSPDPYTRIKNVSFDLLNSSSVNIDNDPETQVRRMALEQRSTAMRYYDPDMPHTLDEFWGPVPSWMIFPEDMNNPEKQYSMVNAWIWVIDGQYCVRAVLSPYRDAEPPYIKLAYIRVPGDWYGIGPAELMMGLQIEKNEVVNTGSDQANLSLNKIVAVIKDKVPKDSWSRLKSAPGANWLFENVTRVSDAFQIIEFPDLGRDWYMKIELLDRAIQEVTGANKVTLGVGGGTDEAGGGTFRGQLLNKQASSERFMVSARVLETCGIGDMYKKMYQRIYQFKSYESVTSVLGEERSKKFEFLPPEKLEQIANLIPLGVMTMETKGVKLAQMGEWVKLFGKYPWSKVYEIARRMWIEMGYSDPDSATFSQEEMDQYNDFRRQLMVETSKGPQGLQSPAQPNSGVPQAASQPIAGNVPPPNEGMPRPAMPARGPGAASIDAMGAPMG